MRGNKKLFSLFLSSTSLRFIPFIPFSFLLQHVFVVVFGGTRLLLLVEFVFCLAQQLASLMLPRYSIILIVSVWAAKSNQPVINIQRIYHIIAELPESLRNRRKTAKSLLILQELLT